MPNDSRGLSTKPRVLIVEPDPRGHHLYYVRVLVDAFRSQGRSIVVLTTSAAVNSAEWVTHLGSAAPEVALRPPPAFALPELEKAATAAAADLTVVPDGDRYLLPLLRYGWSGSGELSLLVLRADGQSRTPGLRQVRGATKKMLAWTAGLRPRVRLSVLRSPLVDRRGPLRWAPDPVTLGCSADDVREIRESLDSYGDRYWIGVFGGITARKNLPLVVEAILEVPDIGILIAGSIDKEVAQVVGPLLARFTEAGGRVHYMPAPLTDAEFDAAISAVDCVVAAHSNEGPSGVVIKAAASGRRLVLAGAKSLKRDATNLGGSATWSKLEESALRQAIRQAMLLPCPQRILNLGPEGFVTALA